MKQMTRVNLRKHGILWMINKAIFHPRGFALAVDERGEFYIQGDGTEVWRFADENDEEGFEDFEALMNKLKR